MAVRSVCAVVWLVVAATQAYIGLLRMEVPRSYDNRLVWSPATHFAVAAVFAIGAVLLAVSASKGSR